MIVQEYMGAAETLVPPRTVITEDLEGLLEIPWVKEFAAEEGFREFSWMPTVDQLEKKSSYIVPLLIAEFEDNTARQVAIVSGAQFEWLGLKLWSSRHVRLRAEISETPVVGASESKNWVDPGAKGA